MQQTNVKIFHSIIQFENFSCCSKLEERNQTCSLWETWVWISRWIKNVNVLWKIRTVKIPNPRKGSKKFHIENCCRSFALSIEIFNREIEPITSGILYFEDRDKSKKLAFIGASGLPKFQPTEQKYCFPNSKLFSEVWDVNSDLGEKINLRLVRKLSIKIEMNQKF